MNENDISKSQNKKNVLHVIIEKRSSFKYFNKNKNVFTLNEFVLTKKEKKGLNHIFPFAKKTCQESESLLLKTNNAKSEIIKVIKNFYFFKNFQHLEELLEPFLEIKLSRFFYMYSVIPNYKKYILITRRKNKSFYSKEDLILAIDKLYSNSNKKDSEFFNYFTSPDFNFFNKFLMNLQKRLMEGIFKKNKIEFNFFSDKKAYFIDDLKKKFIGKNNLIIYYSNTKSFLKLIRLIIIQFLALISFKDFKEVGIFLLSRNNMNNLTNFNKYIDQLRFLELNFKFSNYLLKQIYFYLMHTYSFKEDLRDLFKKSNIKNGYFHSVRFPDLFTFSRALSDANSKVLLISHGSHTIQKNKLSDKYAAKSLATGLAYTMDKRITLLSQSLYCDDFLDSMKLKYYKINRFIKNDFHDNKTLIKGRKKQKLIILLIGTIKPLGARRYYVESSSEFISNVEYIYSKLKKHKQKFKILLRIRDVKNEINQKILNNAFESKSDLISIGNKGSIYKEIKNSDCIISFSSTTLEEALFMKKPVISYGFTGYNHLTYYDKDTELESKYLIDNKFKIIEKCLQRRFIFYDYKNRKIDYYF